MNALLAVLLVVVLTALPSLAAEGGGAGVWPMSEWQECAPAEVGMSAEKLAKARDYALTGGGSGYVTRHGRLVMSWGDAGRKYDLKSTTKSIGTVPLGLVLADGKVALGDLATAHFPAIGTPPDSNAATGWLGKVTLLHLATHTAGFEKPGGFGRLLFEPGTAWSYSDGGPNWLADCLTLAYGHDLEELVFERAFKRMGIAHEDLHWRDNAYRPKTLGGVARREFGSGVHANVDAMARIGYLFLHRGRWQDEQILPAGFVDAASRTPEFLKGLPVLVPERYGNASAHYGLLWWNNSDGTLPHVPRDAYWSWGLHDSFIVVIPSLDIVVSRAGSDWERREGAGPYGVLAPFLGPIVASVSDRLPPAAGAPYPPSPVIRGIEWAPVEQIVRRAEGSDNWPVTWADDGDIYTAYGDGWGFEPKVEEKLSLGLAVISGGPADFTGTNLRSSSAEGTGGGRAGKKASGMLMAGGVLYMWVRNADGNGQQSRLAWSEDHGRTWSWADWRFAELGYLCFLNFGRNYAGARDDYVCVYSPDTPDAYREADSVVLARVPVRRVRERGAYEFFRGIDARGQPRWTRDIEERGTAFTFKGGCNRLNVVHNAPLGRYLMTMRSRAEAGGVNHFGIYDAPEPWGPWTTVYYTEEWEGGPLPIGNGGWGEAQHIPSAWISEDGATFHLAFSGDDTFSVRRARLILAPERE